VMVFTADANVAHMQRALESGVHGYEVNGYGAARLRALVHLAQARFHQQQTQAQALQDISTRFEERKMVDRAKGILMRARQVSDDDAFRILRTVSMHTNQRLGQVSHNIIHSAHFAEAVNRSGQLRMLSQRLLKLHALQAAGVRTAQCAEQFQESLQRIDSNIAYLQKNLSLPTYGDLMGQVVQVWAHLKPVLLRSATLASFAEADALAEQLLQGAERLTDNLESTGLAAPLKVLNIAARQRMLSQRFAKYAVLGVLATTVDDPLVERSAAGMAESRATFEKALTYLNGLPLSTPEIRALLEAAGIGWLQMLAAFKDARGGVGHDQTARLDGLAAGSESLLDVFEQLTGHYERNMQVLVGN
jgi:hypothetical protein